MSDSSHVGGSLGAFCLLCVFLVPAVRSVAAELPSGPTPPALETPYFPNRLHAFVWRNWEWVPVERMAKVCGCQPRQILAIGESMGLADPPPVTEDQWERSYITIIRRNWHLLPYEQLLALLDWSEDKLSFMLKEDDFLYIKLGRLKPKCDPLTYAPPTAAESKRAEEIAGIVREAFGARIAPTGERRFAFVAQLGKPDPTTKPPADTARDDRLTLRYLYSYFALYGDPLSDPDLDPYPQGYLQKLAALGVNGVWMQAVLNQLAPSKEFPEFGDGWEQRLANLRKLVERAKRYGIRIYLYFNEPRTMDRTFFAKHPGIRGVAEGDQIAMCVSTEPVLRWLGEATEHIFRNVPGLGGAFTISASENLTNCWSHHHGENCPRCKHRNPSDVIADTNRAMAEGVWRAAPNAKFIAWDWGWRDDWVEGILANLPKKSWFMSVSEWSLPIERGGVKTSVGEYSISSVGPGPRAQRHWGIARKNGLRIAAKMQINNTWEMAAAPYVPALGLIGKHVSNLTDLGLDGMMLSWTLGGYPSPNLEMVSQFHGKNPPPVDEAMQHVAESRFGKAAAGKAVEAWQAFSDAFREYPYHGGLLYRGPHHWGPANPLYTEPTGYRATMVGIPYDDLNGWRAVYPPEVMAGQFEKIAIGWQRGLKMLREALDATRGEQRQTLESEIRVNEAIHNHVQSVVNQVRFLLARRVLLDEKATAAAKTKAKEDIARIARDELELAKRHYHLCREDSRIGYEASNHYWYVPLDVAEKVINCRYVLDDWLPRQ